MSILGIFGRNRITPLASDAAEPAKAAPSGRQKSSTTKDTKGAFNQLRASGARCATRLLHKVSYSPSKPAERPETAPGIPAGPLSSAQGLKAKVALTEQNCALENEIRSRIKLLPESSSKEIALNRLNSAMTMNKKQPEKCHELLARLDQGVTPLAKRAQYMEAQRLRSIAYTNKWDIKPANSNSLEEIVRFNKEVRKHIRHEAAQEKKRLTINLSNPSTHPLDREAALAHYIRLQEKPMSSEQKLNEYRALNRNLGSVAFRANVATTEARLLATKNSIVEYMESLPRKEGQREKLDALLDAFHRIEHAHSRHGTDQASALKDFTHLKKQIIQGVFEPVPPPPALPSHAGSVDKARESYLLSIVGEEITYPHHDGKDAYGRDHYTAMENRREEAQEELDQLRRRYARRQ